MGLILFRMAIFGTAHKSQGRGGWEVGCQKDPLPKICHTYPAMIKLGSYNLPKEGSKIT